METCLLFSFSHSLWCQKSIISIGAKHVISPWQAETLHFWFPFSLIHICFYSDVACHYNQGWSNIETRKKKHQITYGATTCVKFSRTFIRLMSEIKSPFKVMYRSITGHWPSISCVVGNMTTLNMMTSLCAESLIIRRSEKGNKCREALQLQSL